MMFWSQGGIAAVKEGGELEMVAASSAQFLAVPELTEQMRINLFPPEVTEETFRLAGGGIN